MTEITKQIMQKQIDDLTAENIKLIEKIDKLHEINDDMYIKYMKVSGLLSLYENMEKAKRLEKL